MVQDSKTKRNFIVVNEGFKCLNCGAVNPPLPGSCRNHCRKCLYSLHVDLSVPGDRGSNCGGLMEPVSLDYKSRKGYLITHRCVKCQVKKRNKTAKDDDFSIIIKISQG